MPLNLINDDWIPVRRKDGSRVVIAPWRMAEADIAFPDWPRPDLNIACLELLIGLVFIADPPRAVADWRKRETPDPDRLRDRLSAFASTFELLGDGPRFMQDRERLEAGVNDPNTPDMLFMDSAGEETIRNNADLMVKRDRYAALDAPSAAMALYALQAHAPLGGRGNRTSMRGGGPLVTLVEAPGGLWPLVWANTPYGEAARPEDLPWMRPARTSVKNERVFPQDSHPLEAFFGMPRRLRLVADGDAIVGVVQERHGAKYEGWVHPLTPYYRLKAGAELLPRHPRAGAFGYRNWLGVTARRRSNTEDTARRARVLDLWQERAGRDCDVIVAGWWMKKNKPLDFVFSRAPLVELDDDDAIDRMEGLVEAAESIAAALRYALAPLLAKGEAREAISDEFFVRTQSDFERRLGEVQAGAMTSEHIGRAWVADLRQVGLAIFDAYALPGLADREVDEQSEIVAARVTLLGAFSGYGKLGRDAFTALGLPPPEKAKGAKKGKAT